MVDFLLIAAGAGLLYAGGELLVRGASALARRLGLSPLTVGLTVVAFGTSSPELAATLAANLAGSPQLAVGNVVGSNIANLGLILGVSALIAPLAARASLVRREVPFMIVVSALLLPLGVDGVYGRVEGLFLLALLGLYLGFQLRKGDAPVETPPSVAGDGRGATWRAWASVAAGLVALVLGARLLIAGAVSLARGLGVSETVIGLTLVAVGTSLPELASSLVAALRKESDLLLGNLIGSNVFNVAAILGVAALVRPVALPFAAVARDYWVMMAFSLLTAILLTARGRVGRPAGALLLVAYAGYVVVLFR